MGRLAVIATLLTAGPLDGVAVGAAVLAGEGVWLRTRVKFISGRSDGRAGPVPPAELAVGAALVVGAGELRRMPRDVREVISAAESTP